MSRLPWVLSVIVAGVVAASCRTAPTGPDARDLLARGQGQESVGNRAAALDAYRGAIRADSILLAAHVAYQDLTIARGDRGLLVAEYLVFRSGSVRCDLFLRERIGIGSSRLGALADLARGTDEVAARSAIDLSRSYRERGDGARALEMSAKAVSLLPDDPAAHLAHAGALESRERWEEAEREFEEALDLGAPAAPAQAGRARAFLGAGRGADAVRALAEVPRRQRAHVEYQCARADVAWWQGRTKDVEDALGRALREAPDDPRVRRRLGLLLFSTGRDPGRARLLLGPLANVRSTDAEVLAASGRLDLAAGHAAFAEWKLERAHELAPEESTMLSLLEARLAAGHAEKVESAPVGRSAAGLSIRARARMALGKTAAAEDDLRAALEIDPAHEEATAELALLYERTGRSDTALEILSRGPVTARTAAVRGRILMARGDAGGAEEALRKAVTLGTGDVAAYLDLADLMRRQRRAGERIRWLRAGLAIRPGHAALTLALVDAVGPTADAEALVRGLLRRSPPPVGARVRLVRMLLARGAVEEGLRVAIRALEDRPGAAEAHAALGDAYALAGRPDEAEEAFRTALGRDDRCVDALLGQARLLAMMGPGRAREADTAFAAVLEVDPWADAARLDLARHRMRCGRPDGVAAALEPLVEGDDPVPAALDLTARAQEALDQPDAAIETLQSLRLLEPRDADVHLRLGLLFKKLGRWGEAVFYLRRAERLGASERVVTPLIQEIIEIMKGR